MNTASIARRPCPTPYQAPRRQFLYSDRQRDTQLPLGPRAATAVMLQRTRDALKNLDFWPILHVGAGTPCALPLVAQLGTLSEVVDQRVEAIGEWLQRLCRGCLPKTSLGEGGSTQMHFRRRVARQPAGWNRVCQIEEEFDASCRVIDISRHSASA